MESDRIAELGSGSAYRFEDWPVPAVPRVAAGVYTIWRGDQYIYAGMSGRGSTAESIQALETEKAWGLWTRLDTHAQGRRSGDQFAVYVCDRFIIPQLSQDDVRAVGDGELKLDAETRKWIRTHLAFRFLTTREGAEATTVERSLRSGALSQGLPFLNPLVARTARPRADPEGFEPGGSPSALAEDLGISPKALRAWLRRTYPRDPEEQGTTWELTEDQVVAARAYFQRT